MQLTKNFHIREMACKDGTPVPDDLLPNIQKLAAQLQVIRDTVNAPIHITSAYRTPSHNKAVGGVKNSYHVKGMAADIVTKHLTPKQLAKVIEKLITDAKIQVGGIGVYASFVHCDIRKGRARW